MPVNKLPSPDLKLVRRTLIYDPTSGEVKRLWGSKIVGVRGRRISIGGTSYMVGRLCWYFQTGKWPEEIDHRDVSWKNNKFFNLRDCSHAENTRNTALRPDNKLGQKGVQKHGRQFRVRVTIGGVRKRDGLFRTLEEAKTAYANWSKELHGDFARIA